MIVSLIISDTTVCASLYFWLHYKPDMISTFQLDCIHLSLFMEIYFLHPVCSGKSFGFGGTSGISLK